MLLVCLLARVASTTQLRAGLRNAWFVMMPRTRPWRLAPAPRRSVTILPAALSPHSLASVPSASFGGASFTFRCGSLGWVHGCIGGGGCCRCWEPSSPRPTPTPRAVRSVPRNLSRDSGLNTSALGTDLEGALGESGYDESEASVSESDADDSSSREPSQYGRPGQR